MPDPARPPDPRTAPPVSPASVGSVSTTPDGGRTEDWQRPRELMAASAVSPPGYEVLGELGRGGMGVVYKARQIAAGRLVALKMILAGGYASDTDRQRFRTEAEAIGRLNHPHIVQVYEVGEHQGFPFFSLELCDGGSLARTLNGTPLPAAAAAALCEQLAEAVAFAHRLGIVHRDLKPGNVLLAVGQAAGLPPEGRPAACPTPKIADFGLAKKLDTDQQGPTRSDAVMGTPSYMSPEQAFGDSKRVGPATDVYALGAILYECLTGRPPFRSANVLETLDQVRRREPVPPRQLNPQAPRDLETICLKCLEKAPERRYASAADLAADLRRFRLGEPIKARPVGALEKAVKLARRHPTTTALLSTIVVLVIGSLIALLVQNDRVRAQRDAAIDAEARTEKERQNADRAARSETIAAEKARISQQVAEREGDMAKAATSESLLAQAQLALDSGERLRAREALLDCRAQDRGWEWHWLYHQTEARPRSLLSPEEIDRVIIDPRERWLAVSARTGIVRVYALADGRQLAQLPTPPQPVGDLAFTPDGAALLLACRNGRIYTHEPLSGRLLSMVPLNVPVRGDLLFSPDASRLLCLPARPPYQGTVHDTRTGQPIARWQSPAAMYSLTFAADGKRFAFVATERGRKSALHVHDTATGKQIFVIAQPDANLSWPLFSPDGRHLVTLAGTDTLQLREAATGQLLTSVGQVSPSYAFSPDSRRFLVRHPRGGGTGRFWDVRRRVWVAGGEAVALGNAHRFSFSPGGTRLVFQQLNSVNWRDSFAAPPEYRLQGQHTTVAVAWHPRREQLATLDTTGAILLWDARAGQLLGQLGQDQPGAAGRFTGLSFRPDGEQLAVTTADSRVRILDSRTGQTVAEFRAVRTVDALAWSPDGRLLAGGTAGGTVFGAKLVKGVMQRSRQSYQATVWLWDVPGRRLVRRHTDPQWLDRVPEVFFSPDGAFYGCWRTSKKIMIWATSTGKQVLGERGQPVRWTRPPEGSSALVLAREDGRLQVWEGATGQVVRTLRSPPLPSSGVLWITPDLRRLLVGSRTLPGSVQLYNTQTGRRVYDLPGGVHRLSPGPDGSLAAVTADRRVVVRRFPFVEVRPRARANLSAFSRFSFWADARQLLTPGADRQLRFWEVSTGRLVRQLPVMLMKEVGFSSDGRLIWGLTMSDTIRAWQAADGKPLPWSVPTETTLLRQAVVSSKHDLVIGATQRNRWTAVSYVDGRPRWSFARSGLQPPRLSPDQSWVALTDGASLHCLDVRTGKPRWPALVAAGAELTLEGFTNDGRWLLVPRRILPDRQALLLVDASTGKVQRTFTVGQTARATWTLLEDGKRLTCESSAGATTFDLDSGKQVPAAFPLRPLQPRTPTPDGRFFVEVEGDIPDEQYLVIRPVPSAAESKRQEDEHAARVLREHYALAEEATTQRDWFAARFHLQRLLYHDPQHRDSIHQRLEAIDRPARQK